MRTGKIEKLRERTILFAANHYHGHRFITSEQVEEFAKRELLKAAESVKRMRGVSAAKIATAIRKRAE